MRRRLLDSASSWRVLCLLLFSGILIAVIPVSAICQTDSVQAGIELKSWVDQSEVPFNQELTLTVEASWEGEQDRFSISPLAPPECQNFEIMGSSSLNQSRVEEGKTKSIKIFRFALKPTETGAGRIGSIQLAYVDNVTQDSSSLSTQPISVQIGPPVKEKGPKYKALLILVVVAALIYVVYTAKRKRRRIEISEESKDKGPAVEQESPEQTALKQLEDISQEAQGEKLRNFPSEVYKLLTRYLEAKYQIVTSGKTTDAIMSSISNLDISSEGTSLLEEILSACDLAKFAGESMEREKCEKMVGQVREFLEQNR